MASFQSAFHPIFWLHHCNCDRLYEKYIELEPDSNDEFRCAYLALTLLSPNPTQP